MAFIEGMKTILARNPEGSGVHQGNESHNCKEKQWKWRS